MSAPPDGRIEAALTEALAIARADPALASLASALEEALVVLRGPMRVAVVGLIKAGKSTLLNALLGAPLLPTGTQETTFTVGTLAWSEAPSLRLRFKDPARPAEERPFGELDGLMRRGDDLSLLRGLERVEIGYPNPLLRRMTLVDTPGLASSHREDSANTADFLRLRGKAAQAASEREADSAHAVLYVFSRGIHDGDRSVLAELQGAAAGRTSPLNALGVLGKVDLYWDPVEATDPLEAGRRVAARLASDPRARRLLHGVVPVAGLPAGGAGGLDAAARAALVTLAGMEPSALRRLLATDARFATADIPGVPVPPAQRAWLLDALGAWGVWAASAALRQNPEVDLGQAMAERAGLVALRDLLLRHFGGRARLIKLNAALPRLRAALFALRAAPQGPRVRERLDRIGRHLEYLERGHLSFAQLAALQDLHAGRLELAPEEALQLRAVTGEAGQEAAARLGLEPDAGTNELRARAEALLTHWYGVAHGVDGRNGATVAAALVVARSLEEIAQRLDSGSGDVSTRW
jgi:hypothetical protein